MLIPVGMIVLLYYKLLFQDIPLIEAHTVSLSPMLGITCPVLENEKQNLLDINITRCDELLEYI